MPHWWTRKEEERATRALYRALHGPLTATEVQGLDPAEVVALALEQRDRAIRQLTLVLNGPELVSRFVGVLERLATALEQAEAVCRRLERQQPTTEDEE